MGKYIRGNCGCFSCRNKYVSAKDIKYILTYRYYFCTDLGRIK